MSVRLLSAGDAAVTVEFGSDITPELVERVAAVEHAIDAARERGKLVGVVETVPTFRSLCVVFDPLLTDRPALDAALLALVAQPTQPRTRASRRWRLPVCYGGDFGVDIAAVAEATGVSPDAVVAQHAATDFTVYLLGFMPGLPFMGMIPEALAMPRRSVPRVRVPAGSVAIAGRLSVIYPWESPGGWHLLGRCPVPLFDASAASPVLLAPGDRVRFEAVGIDRYDALQDELRTGALHAKAFLEPGEVVA